MLAELRDDGGARALHRLLLQPHGELRLALLEDGADLLARLAGVLPDHLLQNGADLLAGAFRLGETLEILLRLLADVGVERHEARALLDLVARYRLAVDEDDDGLLGLCRRRLVGGLAGRGLLRSRLGLGRRLLLLLGCGGPHGSGEPHRTYRGCDGGKATAASVLAHAIRPSVAGAIRCRSY